MAYRADARNKFNLGFGSVYNIPKPKSMFAINFIPGNTIYASQQLLNNASFKVKAIDRPKEKIQAQQLNQYNVRRIVQTKLEYDPIAVTFYNTIDNAALALWAHYRAFYYGDGRKDEMAWRYNLVTPEYSDSEPFGYRGDMSAREQYFFKRLDIYEVWGGKYNQIQLINPKIVSVDFSNLDYSSSETSEATFQIMYEGIVYYKMNAPMTGSVLAILGLSTRSQFPTSYNPYSNASTNALIRESGGAISPANSYQAAVTNSMAGNLQFPDNVLPGDVINWNDGTSTILNDVVGGSTSSLGLLGGISNLTSPGELIGQVQGGNPLGAITSLVQPGSIGGALITPFTAPGNMNAFVRGNAVNLLSTVASPIADAASLFGIARGSSGNFIGNLATGNRNTRSPGFAF